MNLSKQEFLNTADSAKYIQDKRKLRAELEAEMAKFLKRGGEIKQAVSQIYKAKHGTADQYRKRSCRCDVCVAWALDNGVIKLTTIKARV
ncbi:hypothetical protein [Acinetobacter silvestris]|uniref:Transcriptional regulator SutA RNAP-binding domain-containing protein n=1 Tax=Acinetobacter silvestris TaxID=1977882 RepID=A0A1Y3CI84_9GAMM|nr:hypothetical protein [Acinetobacter silvestris]OTG65817.1 hypothetical protein B9T28_06350 [Acinetobacter silvestris]